MQCQGSNSVCTTSHRFQIIFCSEKIHFFISCWIFESLRAAVISIVTHANFDKALSISRFIIDIGGCLLFY